MKDDTVARVYVGSQYTLIGIDKEVTQVEEIA